MDRRQTPCLLLCLSYVYFFSITSSASSSPSILRGVHPLDAKYYEAETIQCKDGSGSFARDRVNDDFCDCLDGTDEPGTSACPDGKFYCRNMGSQPRFLFSSRINDHICDCCDGSDEFDGAIYCPNTCIMGGSIRYKSEYRQITSAKTDQAKESKRIGKVEDMIRNLNGLKVLALIQLVIIVLWAVWLFCRPVKSRRRRHR